ncbi:hypothetical protein GCM10010495_45780 [Kitasatospora herbaricolor]|uniref:hypothetical protein n=1 Tax=Kitasatospora herbaricolor TaxID=68217 RepID=UPI00198329DA|nr:hypothetical protein [Kitasatospora herbaricolor]MDQ0312990.1 hypothetical protein [Kitasatospora herbaricolor]GGV24906.1 hypothetical protein GCM10010495_45780 [Kitasatospora herbaricolor]
MATTHTDQYRDTGSDRPPTPGAGPAPRRRAAALRFTGALLAVLLAAACGSSGGSGTSSGSPSAAAAATASAAASGSASASAAASGTAPADAAAAKTEVTTNWEKFFDPATPIADKAALLQGGEQLAPALQGFAGDPRVGQVEAQVTDVQFTSATDATVTYTLSLQGAVVQPDATGQAVLDNGTWKVSRSTLCGLVQQSGATAIPGCS